MSTIEWTEKTWNPATGCTKISPGCKFCYAAILANRLHAMKVKGYENNFKVSLHPERLNGPLKVRKPTTWFVNSMSDLFHCDIHDSFIEQILEVARQTPHHTYQVLTKRAERMAYFFEDRIPPSNVWLGVTVEDKKYGLPRLEWLKLIENVSVRFLSIEPLLEDLGVVDFDGIDWVIVGGESGVSGRKMDKAWVENVQTQCKKSAFFFKQWGMFGEDGVRKRSKKETGSLLNGEHFKAEPVDKTFQLS